jgi:hypothetical protein
LSSEAYRFIIRGISVYHQKYIGLLSEAYPFTIRSIPVYHQRHIGLSSEAYRFIIRSISAYHQRHTGLPSEAYPFAKRLIPYGCQLEKTFELKFVMPNVNSSAAEIEYGILGFHSKPGGKVLGSGNSDN